MNLKYLLIILFTLLFQSSFGAAPKVESKALTMVPKGRIVLINFREVTLKTESGTKVELEFERQGTLQEASGLNLNRGDEFEPGQGLMSLSSVAQKVTKAGHPIKGEWKLEKDDQYGWVYELAEDKDDQKVYHIVNAKTGKLINSVDVPSSGSLVPETSLRLRHQAAVSL
ncbi:MAG TPA: PepSY domain-containing protein [Bacteriovoracaceae bacterium]|nr:PepSY domain-containing protein [Bacteriovoracaceae bacterium]